MGFIYGLAVVLVIFEGIIIQCGGAPRRKQMQRGLINDLPILPNDVIELIISKTDFETIRDAVRQFIVPPNDIVMSHLLQDDIMLFCSHFDQYISEYQYRGQSLLRFSNYRGLVSFFNKFGHKVKSMLIEVCFNKSNDPREKITPNIIKKYAKNLEELRITCFYDEGFWQELSDGENEIMFPEVKKFEFSGWSNRSVLNLSNLFPKLESLKLDGAIADGNCLKNVKGLKELMLLTDSIEESQLNDIFANNKNMTMICLKEPVRMETMQSISNHLTELKTLEFICPGKSFLLRTNNGPVYTHPSMKHLIISCYAADEVFGIDNLSLDMPNLKELTFAANTANERIVEFIAQFKKLEILELSLVNYDTVECIKKFKHIIEFRTSTYQNRFPNLKLYFENLGEETKLQTVKFLDPYETTFQAYENEMIRFNIKLRDSGKPTWTLSKGNQIGTGLRYLMFKRDPST